MMANVVTAQRRPQPTKRFASDFAAQTQRSACGQGLRQGGALRRIGRRPMGTLRVRHDPKPCDPKPRDPKPRDPKPRGPAHPIRCINNAGRLPDTFSS
jgi:hypothetical protein